MYCIYEDYLQTKKSLDIDKMREIHENIIREICDDQDAIDLYEELVKKAIAYSEIRSLWTTMSLEEKIDKDKGRTMTHDALIVKFNQLSRYLKMNGKPADWRDTLGYEEDDKFNRKVIGDMGCYIAFVHALNAR